MRCLVTALVLLASSCSQPAPAPKTVQVDKPVPAHPEVDRCKAAVPQQGREIPEYRSVSGYLGFSSQYDMPDYFDRLPSQPWKIPTLRQSGPEPWDETDVTVDAKLKATVVDVQLKHEGYGRYDGALSVRLEDGRTVLIAPQYFIPTDWWNCGVADAIRYSPVVAEVQVDAKPLDADGRWANIAPHAQVLCVNDGLPGPLMGHDLVVCHAYPSGRLYFDPKSLKVVY
jgi:hypothetical protein